MKAFKKDNYLMIIPDPLSIIKLFNTIKNSDVIYLVSINPFIASYVIFLSKLFKKRLILGSYNPLFPKLFEDGAKIGFSGIFYIRLLKSIKNVHVLNIADRKLFKSQMPNSNIYLIPNFIGNEGIVTMNRSKFIILFVGRLEIEQKGLDLLAKIINLLKFGPDVEIHIIGAGNDGSKLVNKIVAQNKNVSWLKSISNAELFKEYKSANLIISTSRHESFGLALLEAQSYGIPAIAFRITGPIEIIKNNYQGKLIEPFLLDKFSEEILNYYNLWKKDQRKYLNLKFKIHDYIKSKFDKDLIIPKIILMLNGK